MTAEKRVQKRIASGELKIPEGAKQAFVIPRDSNIRFLPAFYFLPAEIIAKSKDCFDIPRSPIEALNDEHWRGLILSDVFKQLVMEGIAYLAWPHIGVYDPKEAFSMDDPLYRWIYATPLFIRHLDKFGYGIQRMFHLKRGEYYRYLSMEEAHLMIGTMVKMVIEKENMAPIIDFVKKNHCDEDFTTRKSRAKIDFLRKKFHTKNLSKIHELSLDQIQEDMDRELRRTGKDIPDNSVNVEEDALENTIVDDFKKTLSENGLKILTLRSENYTYEEISKILGYKTHSGIIKRIDKIADEWLNYVDEENGIMD